MFSKEIVERLTTQNGGKLERNQTVCIPQGYILGHQKKIL